jgi:ATP-binding cassette subfamily B protein
MRLVRVDALFHPLIIFLIGLSTAFTIWIGGEKVTEGTLTMGNIAEFVIYVNLLMWPVTSLGWVTSLMQRAVASQNRINEVLALRTELRFPPESPAMPTPSLAFQQVTYTYPDTGITAIKNVSFELGAGQTLGVVGATGSGKTTLAGLLTRQMDANAGLVLLAGKPIQDWSAEALRGALGYVPQDGFLFSDTIANNIAFGKINATQAEIEAAAKFAGVYDDIMGFPKGFDTLLGERGVTLSGGQKQRVAIARAYLKQPRLLILDDSLSAVDTATEDAILHNLRHNLGDGTTPPTLVIIAHRLSAVQAADRILVLQDGTLAETGTHTELLAIPGGIYAQMHERQQLEAQKAG